MAFPIPMILRKKCPLWRKLLLKMRRGDWPPFPLDIPILQQVQKAGARSAMVLQRNWSSREKTCV
jgi:hypothetical protein